MEPTSLAPLAGLVPAAGFFLLWYLTARKLRGSLHHLDQQATRIQDLRRSMESMDIELAMKDARIARLTRDLVQARGGLRPPLSRTG
ncbi:hypothetical protein [Ruegeria aquimaris]|uniref:Uncharacterized protein n=1 Tax=Ruegeria aquimaris TaxID=2984333 RepID=A0ABT3AKF5_9RHOB|nr:hypothetical protein [Ruegeria sp. XHP0148]MCV2889165.1 hypothetical protein [Ruegeria sp. XHP0148]